MTCINSSIHNSVFAKAFLKSFTRPFMASCKLCGDLFNKESQASNGRYCKTCVAYKSYSKRNNVTLDEYKLYLIDKENRVLSAKEKEESAKTKKSEIKELMDVGKFKCLSCLKVRDIDLKENNRNRCFICNSYRCHTKRRKERLMNYAEFEENFMTRRKFDNGEYKKCVSCLEVKDKSLFSKKRGAHCDMCWQSDEQKKVRRLRKLMRYPIRTGNHDNKNFENAFGYTPIELIKHLESKFTDGMTIEKLISSEIHIDHVIPASLFNHNDDRHVAYCWSLDNLQPMWAKDNQFKHDYLPNGERVSLIRKMNNPRKELDDRLVSLYGFNA